MDLKTRVRVPLIKDTKLLGVHSLDQGSLMCLGIRIG